ncbi:MAG: Na+/H+ antiporter NhaA [Pseudomonadota bacterium]
MNDNNFSNIPKHIQIIQPFQGFFKRFVSGSFCLFSAALLALLWANLSPISYDHFWHTNLTFSVGSLSITKSLIHWIDEALMTLFFFTVGLEIKRELLVGELASPKRALLPIAAALGGMLFPAGIYIALNYGTPAANGWGIPMATDIAFSLAVLAIIGTRIPVGLKVFLSAFAIADDLGAVLVIALFYTQTIVWSYLAICVLFLIGLAVANLFWIRSPLVYGLLGVCIWFGILGSGIHATVAGVVVAMFIPARGKYDTDKFVSTCKAHLERFECELGSCGYSIMLNSEHLNAVHDINMACLAVETPLQRLEYNLHPWIAFLILPLFALANAGLSLEGINLSVALTHPVTLGIILGLVLGKTIGISLFTYMAFRTFKAPLPSGVSWSHIIGVSMLGGIGFSMSLFVSGLSFAAGDFTEFSKLGIIVGSIVSGGLGLCIINLIGAGNAQATSSDGVYD